MLGSWFSWLVNSCSKLVGRLVGELAGSFGIGGGGRNWLGGRIGVSRAGVASGSFSLIGVGGDGVGLGVYSLDKCQFSSLYEKRDVQ